MTVNHPMTKEHYISFLAYVTHDRFETAKLYPRGSAVCKVSKKGQGASFISSVTATDL